MSRRAAREIAVKYIYAWSYGYDEDLDAFIDYIEKPLKNKDKDFCRLLVNYTIRSIKTVDELMQSKMKQNFKNLPQIDKSILRVSITELVAINRNVPAVVINEYVEMTNKYSSESSKRAVNAILDNIKNDLVALEKSSAVDGKRK